MFFVTPLEFNSSPLKRDHPKKKVQYSSKHHFFSGDLLIFRGKYPETADVQVLPDVPQELKRVVGSFSTSLRGPTWGEGALVTPGIRQSKIQGTRMSQEVSTWFVNGL